MTESTREFCLNPKDERVLTEAKREAMEKLHSLKRTLEYYDQNRSLYIDMNGPQRVFTKREIIDRFRESPVLFHRTSNGNDKDTIENISVQGLTTLDFRVRKESVFPSPKLPTAEEVIPDKPYTDDEMWADLLDQEYQMDNAWKSAGREYNHKYISLSFIHWWNVRGVDTGKPVTKHSHTVNNDGHVELGPVSIVLDEIESKKIIDRNCNELESSQTESDFSKAVNDRTVAFAEALEPFRIAPKHIACLFLMEGRIEEIKSEAEKDQFRLEVNKLGLKFKTPIFNYYGDMLWPKEMKNQDVLEINGPKKTKTEENLQG